MFRRLLRRRWLRLLLALFPVAALGILAGNWWMLARARGRIFTNPGAIPANEVAIVLGTSPLRAGGGVNPFFRSRMDAAAALYHAGKARRFLLSGDNGSRDYDEPAAMRAALVARGIPAGATTLDDAGFRTLDTMARAAKVFGLSRATVVTDDFHQARSLFLAHAFGIEAVGFAGRPVALSYSRKTRLREIAGRTVAWLDVYILHTRPKFYGPHENLQSAGQQEWQRRPASDRCRFSGGTPLPLWRRDSLVMIADAPRRLARRAKWQRRPASGLCWFSGGTPLPLSSLLSAARPRCHCAGRDRHA